MGMTEAQIEEARRQLAQETVPSSPESPPPSNDKETPVQDYVVNGVTAYKAATFWFFPLFAVLNGYVWYYLLGVVYSDMHGFWQFLLSLVGLAVGVEVSSRLSSKLRIGFHDNWATSIPLLLGIVTTLLLWFPPLPELESRVNGLNETMSNYFRGSSESTAVAHPAKIIGEVSLRCDARCR